MLGRVRTSPISSLELLEMERSSSKFSKQDSLSIYESTLLKLKQGSQCCQRSTLEGLPTTSTYSTIATDPHDEVMSDADCSSPVSSPNLSGAHSSNEKRSTKFTSRKQWFPPSKNASIHSQNAVKDYIGSS